MGVIKLWYLDQLLVSSFLRKIKINFVSSRIKTNSKIVKFCKCLQVLGTFCYVELVKNLTNSVRTVTANLAYVGLEIFIGGICYGDFER